jgi:TATA-box binding protein (TBP) (component of TFIID and TFIIIB)|tara:strand:- start:7681 stop:8211 length:531 start_codon:yes stop_codon:yes gene_type:complete
MEEEGRIRVQVETHTFRFIPGKPINHADAVRLAKGIKSGPWVVISHKEPRATFVIEESGSVLIHGISRLEVARLVMQELLLSLGMSEDGLRVESGDMLVSFSLGRAVLLELAASRFADINKDARVGCIRIDAKRHKAELLIFNNGHGVVIGQNSKRVAEMAVRHWASLLDEEGALA